MFKVEEKSKAILWWTARRDDIDMEPSYQRKSGLWSQKDQAYLIDSIINGFDVPKLYVADFTFYPNSRLNEKDKQYAVIDGKQRFEAIYSFLDGEISLDRNFKYLANPNLKLGGLGYQDIKELYPKIALEFEGFNLAVVLVHTNKPLMINDMFIRLNRSKSLTGAEIRNAMVGPLPLMIREIATHDFFQNNVKFNVKRGADLNTAAKLLLLEVNGKLVSTKKIDLDRLVEEGNLLYDSDDKQGIKAIEYAKNEVMLTLKTMSSSFLRKDSLLKSEGPTTLYYWLFREFGRPYGKNIRYFLNLFDGQRKDNSVSKNDKELNEFEVHSRSTNDQGSLNSRYIILRRRFKRFIIDTNIPRKKLLRKKS